jgi:diadenosine tetraphosphate (Ap4A) HIT family hydrolase
MEENGVEGCPFCNVPVERIVLGNKDSIVIKDIFPVSAGHSLVLPIRHVETMDDLGLEEIAAMMINARSVMRMLSFAIKPAGFNVGFNLGEAAGQTIGHVHMHVIPRFDGDVPEPRGGIRGVIPHKRDY